MTEGHAGAGCEKCKSARRWVDDSFEELAAGLVYPTFLYRCRQCGTLWNEGPHSLNAVTAAEAHELYPNVQFEPGIRMLRSHSRGDVVKQIWSRDRQRCVRIIRNGNKFTFQEDASSDGVTYDSWPNLRDGGWYMSAELAEQDARKIIPWVEENST